MIAGYRTAAEAKANALFWQQINSGGEEMKSKIISLIRELELFQENNPTVLSVSPQNKYIPTQSIAPIQTTFGYVITASAIPGKPPGSSPLTTINNWSRITKVSWE